MDDFINLAIILAIIISTIVSGISQKKRQRRPVSSDTERHPRSSEEEPEGQEESWEDIFGPPVSHEKKPAEPQPSPQPAFEKARSESASKMPSESDDAVPAEEIHPRVRDLQRLLKKAVAVEQAHYEPSIRERQKEGISESHSIAQAPYHKSMAQADVVSHVVYAGALNASDPVRHLLEGGRYTPKQRLFVIANVLNERGGYKPAGRFRSRA